MASLSPARFARRCLVPAAMALAALAAHAQTTPAPSRGELLYTTHCIACHTSQMHWRSNRRAHDWESLTLQVRLWQGNTGLRWDEADIAEVAGYLNDTIYRYPRTAPAAPGLPAPPQRISAAR
ncbi:cytochrome C [Polaromonas sp. YR568]|uniref:cytochrome C n=1 Tax=Polaromonas sp. YR568 TaxID=1855301 RepID=UPI00398BCC1D